MQYMLVHLPWLKIFNLRHFKRNIAFCVTVETKTQQLKLSHLSWKSQHGSFAAAKNNISLNIEQITGVSAGPPEKLLNKRSMFLPTY